MIDEAHRTRKCDTCRAKGKEGVEITPSKGDADLRRECRQSKTGQNKESCCGECEAYKKGMQGGEMQILLGKLAGEENIRQMRQEHMWKM